MTRKTITAGVHAELIASGYKYLLLTNVECIEKPVKNRIIYKPVKEIPCSQYYSCTGISDEVIIKYLSGGYKYLEVYVDMED